MLKICVICFAVAGVWKILIYLLLYTENVETMSYMFNYCLNLNNIDLSSFNTENVKNMSYMFCNCQNLKNIDLSSFNTEKVTNKTCMFNSCFKLERVILRLEESNYSQDIGQDKIIYV